MNRPDTGRQTRVRLCTGRGTLKRTRLASIGLIVGLLWFSTGILYSQNLSGSGSEARDVGVESTDDGSTGGAASAADGSPREEDLVFADGDGGAPVETGGDELSAFGIWDLVRMVLVLLLVVAAVYGLIMLLRRRVGRDETEEDSPITILASRNLGGSRDLHVVMIGSRVLLLGGGDAGVELLTTIDDQETIDELVLAHSSRGTTARRTFGGLLGQWLGNMTIPGSGGTAGGEAAPDAGVGGAVGGGFLRTQHDRLRHMR